MLVSVFYIPYLIYFLNVHVKSGGIKRCNPPPPLVLDFVTSMFPQEWPIVLDLSSYADDRSIVHWDNLVETVYVDIVAPGSAHA